MIENEPQKSQYEQAKTTRNKPLKAETINPTMNEQSHLNSKYELLSGYLDGELTQQEAQKVMLLLQSDAEYQQLHDEMVSMRQEIQSLSLQESELEHLDKLFQEPVAKTTRVFGFSLLAIGALILVGFVLYSVLMNAAVSFLVKSMVVLLGLGSLLLLFSVLRQRLVASKSDKYNRVKL